MEETYICAMCGGKFTKGWTDKEAEAEAKETWGDIPEEEKAVVCDDCYNKIHPNKFPLTVKITKAALKVAKAFNNPFKE